MRPNLTIERLAVTLAALGTSAVVVAACTHAEPAATSASPDKPMPSASAAPPPPAPDESKKSEAEKEPTIATATATASAQPAPVKHRAPGDKGGTGQASCGAGTCTADPKKK